MKKLSFLCSASILLSACLPALATPYAAGLTNNAGTVSFFLNEDADNVKVVFNSGTGGTNDLGALTRGKYTFSLGAHTNYSVLVTKASGAGYKSDNGSGAAVKLQISSTTNRALNFEFPRGLKVNRNPASRYFGRIYGGNIRTNATALGRPMGIGVYMINPDQTSAHQAGQEDLPQRPANWPLSPFGSTSSVTFPYDFAIGQDDNLYVADWTDSTGNLWVTDAEAADPGGSVLKLLSTLGSALVPVGVDNTHGSINAAHVEGSLAAGTLTVWTIDEDLQTDKTTSVFTEVSSLWRYDVGLGPLPFLNDATKVWTASGKQGVAFAYQTGDMVRSTNGYFYIIDQRSVGDESGLAIVDGSGTPIWNSWTASQSIRVGKDILTNSYKVAISFDDKYVAVARATGIVWILPLVNGIPDLSKRLILTPFSSGSSLRGLAFDAAGNLYVSSNSSELIGVFSPGGTTVAVTRNDAGGTNGGFFITAPATTVSVVATVGSVTESGGTNGIFTITRAGDTSVPLTVGYGITGSATSGTDFTIAGGSVTLAAFQVSTNLAITPVPDTVAELTETVILTLQGGAGYSVGSPGSATVSIIDDETPEISFEAAAGKKLLESYAPSKVTYQLTRRGLLTPALSVNLTYSGSATLGADFNGPASVSFGAGAATANITLTPVNDQAYEGNETATVSVAAGTGYQIGTNNSASATIIDDEYPPGAVLFSDDFEVDSSPLWQVNFADPSDGFVDFAYDYSVLGIPPAPGGGGTRGMRFRCGNTVLEIDAISASPTNGNFTGNYRVKFDMWINYNGPMPDGGPGSTQNFDTGVGTTGDRVVWRNNPDSDGVWFSATGDGADGNTGGDYDAYIGPNIQNDDTGFYAAGTSSPNSGIRDAFHPFYALWGGQAAPAAQLSLYPSQSGVANIGNAGMAWHTVVVTKATNVVVWAIDGITIATVTNDVLPLSTNVFIGYQDLFASGSLSDNPDLSFGLVDNFRVESFVSAPIHITGIKVVGSNVEVSFTASATAAPTDFKLQSSALVTGTYTDDNTAIITTSGGGFKATTALNGGTRFYRIKQ